MLDCRISIFLLLFIISQVTCLGPYCSYLTKKDWSDRFEDILKECKDKAVIRGEPIRLTDFSEQKIGQLFRNKSRIEMDLSLVKSDWTSLRFDALKQLTHYCVIEENDKLQDIFLYNLKSNGGSMRVRANRRLLPVWIDILKKANQLNIQPPGECLTKGRTIISPEELRDCRTIGDDLTIAGRVYRKEGESFGRIEKVDGCLKIVKTNLSELDFLFATKLKNCSKRHRIEGNNVLCNAEHTLSALRRANPGQDIIWKNNCESKEEGWNEQKESDQIVQKEMIVPFITIVTTLFLASIVCFLIWTAMSANKKGERRIFYKGVGPFADLTLKELGLSMSRRRIEERKSIHSKSCVS